MLSWLIRWILNVAGIIFLAAVIQGFEVTIPGAIVGSIVFGLINATIRPVLILLTLPINFLTLGLFTLVINGFLLWLVGLVVIGFELQSFGVAFITAILLMLISSIVNKLVKD